MLRNKILTPCFYCFECLQLTIVTSIPSRVETQVQSLIALKCTIQEQSKIKNTTMLEKDVVQVCVSICRLLHYFTLICSIQIDRMEKKNLGETRLSRGASSALARRTSSLFQLQQTQSVRAPLVPVVFS